MTRSIIAVFVVISLGQGAALAAPLVPHIESDVFNFAAMESGATPLYEPRGADPDYLTLASDPLDREVTMLWTDWPMGGFPEPIFNQSGDFGGDIELNLQFDGEDAVSAPLDVSLTGAGRNVGADLIISGTMPSLGITTWQTLIEIEVFDASLYGYGGEQSFTLETAGEFTFVHSALPGSVELVGKSAVSAGVIHLFDFDLPSVYDPQVDYGLPTSGGGYLGEVGHGFPTPEPASLLTLLIGAGIGLRRRR